MATVQETPDLSADELEKILRDPKSGTEFRILRFLAMRGGRLVTRGQIIEAAMGDEACDKSVNPHISRLRQKLHDHSQRGVRLVSIRTEGYRLEASS